MVISFGFSLACLTSKSSSIQSKHFLKIIAAIRILEYFEYDNDMTVPAKARQGRNMTLLKIDISCVVELEVFFVKNLLVLSALKSDKTTENILAIIAV